MLPTLDSIKVQSAKTPSCKRRINRYLWGFVLAGVAWKPLENARRVWPFRTGLWEMVLLDCDKRGGSCDYYCNFADDILVWLFFSFFYSNLQFFFLVFLFVIFYMMFGVYISIPIIFFFLFFFSYHRHQSFCYVDIVLLNWMSAFFQPRKDLRWTDSK